MLPPPKSPENYSLLTYIWVIGLSAWGGVAHHLYKLQVDKNAEFSLFSFLTDVIISGFVGVITFFLCESNDFDPLVTASIVGISSHMGTRSIKLFRKYLISRYVAKECDVCSKKSKE